MMIRSLRCAYRSFSQPIRRSWDVYPKTSISTTSVSRASLIQDLYLKELKAYKPSPPKNLDSAGHVQKFSPPKPPQPPSEGDIASELKEYESQQVEVEGQAAAGEASNVERDWFVDDWVDEEEEEGKAKEGH